MSRVRMVVDVDDLRVEPLGVKEAATMALEFLGGVQVLSVEIREEEQMRIAGGAFAPPRRAPKPESKAPVPPRTGQAPARSSPRPQTAMVCCFSCAHYRSDKNRDADGNPYWGICERTKQPVYDLKERCKGWARLGG